MSIHKQVLTFIHRPEPESFDRLAMDVFRHQFETVDAYRRYCVARGVEPDAVGRVDDIPAVSNVAFKYADLARRGAEQSPDAAVFLTSGTTQGRERRGRHVVARPEIYRASAIAHLRTMLFPDAPRMAILAMHPTADVMPESSLSAMISWSIEEFGTRRIFAAASRERVDVAAAIAFLVDCEARREPVCIMGTTAAFAALVSGLSSGDRKIRLAAGSRMMDTGGAKGQRRADASLGGYRAGGRFAGDRACDGYQRIRDDGIVLAALRRDVVQLRGHVKYAGEIQNSTAVAASDGAGSGYA